MSESTKAPKTVAELYAFTQARLSTLVTHEDIDAAFEQLAEGFTGIVEAMTEELKTLRREVKEAQAQAAAAPATGTTRGKNPRKPFVCEGIPCEGHATESQALRHQQYVTAKA